MEGGKGEVVEGQKAGVPTVGSCHMVKLDGSALHILYTAGNTAELMGSARHILYTQSNGHVLDLCDMNVILFVNFYLLSLTLGGGVLPVP